MGTMLILRGISGTFAGKTYKRGALDEESALRYADRRGYRGKVLDVSGETGASSEQTRAALITFRSEQDVEALYGFSGGGYNVRHVLDQLSHKEKARLKLVVVLGAPRNPPELYTGASNGGDWELVYRRDPPGGHMDGPRALLGECTCE